MLPTFKGCWHRPPSTHIVFAASPAVTEKSPGRLLPGLGVLRQLRFACCLRVLFAAVACWILRLLVLSTRIAQTVSPLLLQFAAVARRVLLLLLVAALTYAAVHLGAERADFLPLAERIFREEQFVTFFNCGRAPRAVRLPFADHRSLLSHRGSIAFPTLVFTW